MKTSSFTHCNTQSPCVVMQALVPLQYRSSLVVSAPDCSMRGPTVRSSPRMAVFIASATVIRSLGHGLHIFTAVPRSTQPCIPGVAKSSTTFSWGKGGWQVTLCDSIWHVSSSSDVAMLQCELLHPYTLLCFCFTVPAILALHSSIANGNFEQKNVKCNRTGLDQIISCAFPVAALRAWNSLPSAVRATPSFLAF